MSEPQWSRGDRIVHAARPEWGIGEVLSVTNERRDGADSQRLTVRFARAGTKTVSTAVATLRAAESGSLEVKPFAPVDHSAGSAARLTELPDAATDPFRPLASRIDACIGLYRFSAEGASLIDWAAAQTGLDDPLSTFSRHELEHGFERFRTALDAHLKKLVLEAKAKEPAALAGLGARVSPQIKTMLTRMLTGR